MMEPKGSRSLSSSEDLPPGAFSVSHIENGEIINFLVGGCSQDACFAIPALNFLASQGKDAYLITNPGDEVVLPPNLTQAEDE